MEWRKSINFALRNQEDMVSSGVRHIPTNELNLSKMNAKIFSIVTNANKGSFASVKTLTKVNIPQKLGLGTDVTKYTDKVVKVGANYESSVNLHRKAEGVENDFKAEKLPWGEWLVVDRVITHKGKTYYRVYDFEGNINEVVYYVNGEVANEEQLAVINAYLASKTHTSRQGVENEVRPTNIEESNIIYIKCGAEYTKQVESTKVAVAYAK